MSIAALRFLSSLLAPLALVLLWWAYVVVFDIPRFVLPSPPVVWNELMRLFVEGEIWPHLGHTVGVIAIGLTVGSLCGAVCGFAVAKSRALERVVSPYLLFLQAAPKIALAPLFILWFGLGLISKIVLTSSLVFFPVMIGTILGLRSLPPAYGELATILRLTRAQRLWRIELPAAVPELFAGLKVAGIQATIGAILAEWLSGGLGLGYLMVFAGTTYRTPMLFAMVLVTSLLGIFIYQTLSRTEKWLLSWR